MKSLRNLLDHDHNSRDAASALLRSCSLLMEGIAVHAVNQDKGAYLSFRDSVRHLRNTVEDAESGDQVLVATGQVIQTMEIYNQEIESFLRLQSAEFHEMVHMLSRTISKMMQEGAQASENLGQIEKQLETVSRLDDLRLIKGKLKESLQEIAQEAARQKESAEKITNDLRARVDPSENLVDARDNVTGLLDAAAAQRAIARAIETSAPVYVAVLCVERLDAINSRFGYAVGDRLMFLFAQEAIKRLSPQDKLFRWRGPTLLAMLERSGRMQDVRIEISHLAAIRQEHSVEFQGRKVLLPMTIRSSIISLKETGSPETAMEMLQAAVTPSNA